MDSFASVYPSGAAALALLFLRISLAGQLLFVTFASALALPDWSLPVSWLVALGLTAGIWTRACAAVLSVAAASGFILLRSPMGPLIGFDAISSFAVALLGPGACAVDALLFGRRVISLES